jgi:RNA-directed DNA polymerase
METETKTVCKVERLRTTLGQKAKQEKNFRFYTLYGHIWRTDVLWKAWIAVARNGGAPGVDGVAIEDFDTAEKVEKYLEDIQISLRDRTYRPQPVKRVYIPKANGKLRPLGIPTIKDRIVQAATLLILEPIFEADFLECSYGFRPKRSAHDALRTIQGYLKEGYTEVYDADLQSYFDTIPHDKLMKCLEKRIADRHVLRLIKWWLEAPVWEEKDGKGPRITRPHQGTPQGGVISPLLANLYLHWFDKVFYSQQGPSHWAKAKLVRYADDYVVMAKCCGEDIIKYIEEKIEKWLGLKINKEKTKVINLKKGEELNFLGYTFVYHKDLKGRDKKYLNIKPSDKAIAKEKEKLREMTSSKMCFKPIQILIEEINRNLKGWANYFSFGYPRCAKREINRYARERLKIHVNRRSQRRYKLREESSYYEQFKKMGLIYL